MSKKEIEKGKPLGKLIVRLHAPNGRLGLREAYESKLSHLALFNKDEIEIDPTNKDSLRKGVFDLVLWLVMHPDAFFTAQFKGIPEISASSPVYYLLGNIYGVFDEKVLSSGMYTKRSGVGWARLGATKPKMIWDVFPDLFKVGSEDHEAAFMERFKEFQQGADFILTRRSAVATFLPLGVPYLLGSKAEYDGDKRYKEIIETLAGEMRKMSINDADVNDIDIDKSIYYLGDKEIKIADLRQGTDVTLYFNARRNRYEFP